MKIGERKKSKDAYLRYGDCRANCRFRRFKGESAGGKVQGAKRILDAIMEKKARLILNAISIQDVLELSNPPKPYYDGGKWMCSKNSVPEEEMIWWTKRLCELHFLRKQ